MSIKWDMFTNIIQGAMLSTRVADDGITKPDDVLNWIIDEIQYAFGDQFFLG